LQERERSADTDSVVARSNLHATSSQLRAYDESCWG
jgi:hypothetical protein